MSTIVVADDNPFGRELLVTVLGYGGHRVLAAQDGAEALQLVHQATPDLVIADVLMPTMDGYEFVRQLREDPSVASTPVIFYTAAYLEQAARSLAERCGVLYVLTKPVEPEVLLNTVSAVLGAADAPRDVPTLPPDFERQHLRLLNDRLVTSQRQLGVASERLAALVDFGLRLTSESNPDRLLQMACDMARQLLDADSARIELQLTSGTPRECDVLAAPLLSSTEAQRCIVVHREGGWASAEEDERVLRILASQVGLHYDNAYRARELALAVRARDEFLSIAAHELKTPITAVLGYSQLLSARGLNPLEPESRQARALRTLEQQALKLSRLVSQLLSFSGLEIGKLQLDVCPTDLGALVQAVTAMFRQDGHNIVESISTQRQALVDPLRIEQVVTNLVQNAVRYSPKGTAIDVHVAEHEPEHVIDIVVRDHGPGIPPEKRTRIFDRFFQAHTEHHASGMGLGLYISRRLVERHGGQIRAEFPDDGGSRFVVSLPL